MNERGFTLIETMMVFVVAAILLIAALPAAVRYRATLRGAQAAEQLAQDLRGARQRAVTGRRPVIVAFGNGSTTTNVTTYTVHRDANSDRIYQSGELRTSRTMPSGTQIATVSLTPVDSLIFDISGLLWPSTNGGSLMLLSGKVRDTLDISATGMVYRR